MLFFVATLFWNRPGHLLQKTTPELCYFDLRYVFWGHNDSVGRGSAVYLDFHVCIYITLWYTRIRSSGKFIIWNFLQGEVTNNFQAAKFSHELTYDFWLSNLLKYFIYDIEWEKVLRSVSPVGSSGASNFRSILCMSYSINQPFTRWLRPLLALGTIHRRRRQLFWIFDTPYPVQCRQFF